MAQVCENRWDGSASCPPLFGRTGIDPEMVCYLDYDSDRASYAEPDPTRRVHVINLPHDCNS